MQDCTPEENLELFLEDEVEATELQDNEQLGEYAFSSQETKDPYNLSTLKRLIQENEMCMT